MCAWNTVCHKGGPVNQLAQHQGWPLELAVARCVWGGRGHESGPCLGQQLVTYP